MQHNGRECIGEKSDHSLSAYKNQTFSIDESRAELVRAMPRQEKVHAMNFSIDESRAELVRAMPRQEKVHAMNFSTAESRAEPVRAMPRQEKVRKYKQCNNPIKKNGKYLYIRFLWFNLQVQSKKRFCAYKTDVLLTRLITG